MNHIENSIENRIILAKTDRHALNSLLSDYMPFIKKQISAVHLALDWDDMLSIAMLTFSGCVAQYEIGKGNFLAFATVSIKNRLIDEDRKERRHTGKIVSLYSEGGVLVSPVGDISLQKYNVEAQRQTLSWEIDALSAALLPFGITFRELSRICPKQDRARRLCFGIVKLLLSDEHMKKQLFRNKQLAQAELAAQLSISAKTIEKHRKYLVTLAVLMSGDYPGIQAFLPQYKEVR